MTRRITTEKQKRSGPRQAAPTQKKARRKNATSEWTVSYGLAGPPGWLAYLMELHIRRCLEQSWPSRPKQLAFDSSKQLCQTLGLSTALPGEQLANALRQLVQLGVDRKQRTVYHGTSIDYTGFFKRYEGSITIGSLEDPQEARLRVDVLDTVFDYWGLYEVLPLNPGYYQQLAPGPRSLYEWLSYRLYAAALERRATATIGYADFCCYALQPRQSAVAKVQEQMEALHRPHFQSGYLAEVTYEAVADTDGLPDWTLTYRAGERARKEFRQFRSRNIRATSPPPDFYAHRGIDPAREADAGSSREQGSA